jgi:AmpE protein
MTLMTILICLIAQRYIGLGETLHKMNWLNSYARYMHKLIGNTPLWQGIWGVIALLIPLIFLVAFIDHLLQGWFFNFFKFLFDLFILLYCLNARDLRRQLTEYFNAYSREDSQASYYHGFTFIKKSSAETPPEDSPHLVRAVTRAIFLDADQHIFAVIFWYIVLGPVGAVLYYLVNRIVFFAKQNQHELSSFKESAKRIQGVLDWIPVRITGLSYALAGHFSYAFAKWLKYLKLGPSKSQELAYRLGLAALELDETDPATAQLAENNSALTLIDRSLVIWIVVIAIFTMGAWIS